MLGMKNNAKWMKIYAKPARCGISNTKQANGEISHNATFGCNRGVLNPPAQ